MAVPTIFERIRESVKVRRKAKKKIDEIISLNNREEEEMNEGKGGKINLSSGRAWDREKPIRLLDEGALFYEGGDEIRLFIEKGTIQNFYDELDEDFVGYINLAHFDLWSFPIVLGTWTKEDLSIVDIGDGRKGLEVIPHFNEDLNLVKDIFAQEIPMSVSVEAYFDINWELTKKLEFPVMNKMFIDGFSVVGNPANTSSMDVLETKEGEGNMDLNKIKSILGMNEQQEEEQLESVEEEVLESEEQEEEETLETESNEEEDAILSLVQALVDENNSLKDQVRALKAENEKHAQKTESVIGRLESIVNCQSKDAGTKSKTDSVWG